MAHASENFYADKSVLVTGGCGFIGSHLVERLVLMGSRVTVMDDLSTGSLANIESVNSKVTFLKQSITDFDACWHAAKDIDIIFHQAALVSVVESVTNPLHCSTINCTGTVNLLEAARIRQVSRFIYASSAAVYGNQEGLCNETTPLAPTSAYGLSKMINELQAQHYTYSYGLCTTGLRYFNVYGPRQSHTSAYAAVIATFTYRMAHNLPITVFGDGTQTRDFISVNQIVDANILLGSANPTHTKGQVFNIATGTSITLLDTIARLRHSYPQYTREIEFRPKRPGDLHTSQADCSKYNRVKSLGAQTEKHN